MVSLRQDYQKKKFKNPYHSPKNQKPRLKKARFFFIGFILVSTSLVFLIARADYFKIQKISISGNDFISESEISQIALSQLKKSRLVIFPQDNILFFDKKSLKKSILSKYYLNNLEVDKEFWHEIKIIISEKPIKLIYSTNQKKFFIDDSGIIANEHGPGISDKIEQDGEVEIVRPASQAANLPVIIDRSDSAAEVGTQILNKDYISFILNIDQKIKDEADFKVKEFQIKDPASSDLFVLTNQGWEVRLNMSDSYLSQSRLLFLILNDKVKDRSNLEYIDLRFGDKVYYQ